MRWYPAQYDQYLSSHSMIVDLREINMQIVIDKINLMTGQRAAQLVSTSDLHNKNA